MTRIANRLAMAGLLLAISCSGSSGILTLGVTYTLQGVVADAVTGQRIGGDLKLFLIQGPEVRGPSRLITGANDPLMGEYAFTGIPVEFASGNNKWKVVAVKSGYQRFESEITFIASTVGTATGGGVGAILDAVYSKIGNIYLFPVGVTAPDYTFVMTYNGKPVPGATVQLDPISASNGPTFITGSTLAASNGYVASLSAQTDASGKVTFAGTLLAVGAQYNIQVLPVIFKETPSAVGVQIGLVPAPAATSKPSFIAGLDVVLQNFTLTDLTPATTAEPLFIADASNRVLNQLQPNGTLVVTFSLPVTLVNPNGFGAAFSPGFKADGTTPGTSALNSTQPVTASLSADGLTLTLAPNYTGSGGQAPGATDRSVLIHYANGTGLVVPKDYPAVGYAVLTPGPGGGTPVLNTAFKMPDGTTGETGFVVIAGP